MANRHTISPNRVYVAVCNTTNFNNHYLRRFTLPERDPSTNRVLGNNGAEAAWYFLNHLDLQSCIEMVITDEALQSVHTVS